MFQYAMGRSMALARNTQLKLDIYSFEESNKRTFDLGQFKIQKQLATRQEIGKFKLPQTFLEKLLRPKNFVQEAETFTYRPEVLRLRGDSHLVGYWIHLQYLKKHLDVIAEDFTLEARLSPQAKKLKAEIRSTNSLAIHIRLGDYHKDPQIKSMFQVCGPDYYKRALDHMRSKFPDLTVFVFSDDIDIAKEWLGKDRSVNYVKITDAPMISSTPTKRAKPLASVSVNEFELMRACKHIIISNSTFSWWAAFLGDYETEGTGNNRTVCVPNKWLNYKTVNLDAIIPKSWVRIAVEEEKK
jgi:hypothetical protein